jgi:predicted transcriptional regulator
MLQFNNSVFIQTHPIRPANYQIMVDINHNLVYNLNMLEGIFGNKTAEKVLLHIFHYGESHASAIAQDFQAALNPIIQQLNRFEAAGVLVSKEAGRSRIYSFNPKSALAKPIMNLIEIAYESIPLAERQKIFESRRRPRRKGKPTT